MEKEITVTFEPIGIRVKTEVGRTIFDIVRETGLAIRSECGGRGICGKCKIIVSDPKTISALTKNEETQLTADEIRKGYRLACLTKVRKDLLVTIPQESRIVARKLQLFGTEKRVKIETNVEKIHLTINEPTLEDLRSDLERLIEELKRSKRLLKSLRVDYHVLKNLPDILRNKNWEVTVVIWNEEEVIAVERGDTTDRFYGLAIDVGTSKIVVHVVNLLDGKTVATSAIENPQMMYGEDIISRITYAIKDKRYVRKLQLMLINGVNETIKSACREAKISPKNIYEVIFVGNTAMHHFFFGISPKHVSLSPYVPAVRQSICAKARQLNVKVNPNAVICSLPIIGGFVGSDAVADVLAIEMYKADKPSLLLDIGTNTEVFLGDKKRLMCCSCASGPAFEGVNIKHGVKAVDGAIERVKIESPSEVKFDTINDVPPIGICGTGIIDAIAEMFRQGIIGSDGRFVKTIKSPRLKKISEERCFVIAQKSESGNEREIVITQKDINEVQLAKAAIFAGCSVLIKKAGLPFEALNKVFIAGAFGTSLNPESAKILGLVPDVDTRKIEFVGNTAIVGGKKALLSISERRKTANIIKRTTYVELAAEPNFAAEFSKALFIPHRELEMFPSAKKPLGKT
jgi:uncharacterized 2Fe-2S/4Fe-4S cluster protein (DUF4445 family)